MSADRPLDAVRKVLHDVEVVSCGGFWKAWGYLGNGYDKCISSDDGHVTHQLALRQLRDRARKERARVKDYVVR